jgi:hypothetical protein
VNAARLISGKGSSSWPTISVNESKNSVGKSQEHRNSIPLGTMAAMQDAANWPTPEATSSCHGHGGTWSTTQFNLHNAAMGVGILPPEWPIRRPDNKTQTTKERMARRAAKHGQAAPASSSSLGSRQGLWLTPRANEPTGDSTFVTRNGDRGQHCSPSLTIQVEKTAQWGTPAANDANKQNVMCEVNSKQAGLPKSVGLELQRQWATPRNCGGPDYAKTTRPSSQSNSLSLPTQVAGKLNPRWVEALMGLPIGWVMPSCTSPQTIELMSCDSLAMELCLPPQSEPSEFSLAS